MKKTEQIAINNEVVEFMNKFNDEHVNWFNFKSKQLRTCSAHVYESGDYAILRSYNTIVAIYDKATNTMYDILRLVYGYTSTSCQHISKFRNDYCGGWKKNPSIKTWRAV